MASSAPVSSVRKLFEELASQVSSEAARLSTEVHRVASQVSSETSRLSAEVERLLGEARDNGRRDLAEQLNQGARRMGQVSGREELIAVLTDAAALLAEGAALFRIDDGSACGERIRGIAEPAAQSFVGMTIPLALAPALASAVGSREPVTAAATAGEVSPELAALAGHAPEARVSIYPLEVRDRVAALLYTWGNVQGAAAELLCQVAAAVWTRLEPPAAPPPLVQIAAPAPPPEPAAAPAPAPARAWDSLPVEEQRLHLRAQRFARVQVAEMQLHEPQAVQAGRTQRDLYGALRQPIDGIRKKFRTAFFAPCPSMVDYLHLELVRSLAHDDPELLGKDYPGPLV